MKLTDCTFCLPSFSGGGAERVFVNLISEFSSRNNNKTKFIKGKKNPVTSASQETCGFTKFVTSVRLTCIVMSGGGAMQKLLPDDCNLINVGSNSAKMSLVRLAIIFNRQKPMIVMSTLAYFNFIIIMALMLSMHRPQRILLREANVPSSTIKSLPARWLGPFLYRWLYNRANCVICNSSETMEELVALGVDRSRVTLIPNPVDIATARKKAQEICALPSFLDPSLPLFVSVGRLVQQKGMDRLISWIASMKWKANLLIIGEGTERTKLEMLIESCGLNGFAKIIDFQENPFPFMSKADAVLLGSRWEGLPNVALEALALGKTVVATVGCGGLLDMKNFLDDQTLVIAGSDEAYILELNRIASQRQLSQTVKKIVKKNCQLADSKLPSEYGLDSVIAKYEAAIFGR